MFIDNDINYNQVIPLNHITLLIITTLNRIELSCHSRKLKLMLQFDCS
jgi:hypothetical protein